MIQIEPISPNNDHQAEALAEKAFSGSFIQTRKFLSYHQNRFEDHSLLALKENRPVCTIHAARSLTSPSQVISHPGITFGGLLADPTAKAPLLEEALVALCKEWKKRGFRELVYKAVPTLWRSQPIEDDIYILHRLGATWTRCDLGAVVDLSQPNHFSQRRQRGIKKAKTNQLQIEINSDLWPQFWAILEQNLQSRHGVKPTHSLEEIKLLQGWFPSQIKLHTAQLGSEVVAGVVTFGYPNLLHAQYIGSSEAGQDFGALDLLFASLIDHSRQDKQRYFSFGISTESAGKFLNEGLYRFKSEFGAFGLTHSFYTLNLDLF